MDTTEEILADVPLFAHLDAHERSLLADRLDVISVSKGQAMFHYGDPGDSLYVLRRGEVELYVKNKTGERMVLETAGAGDFFGEVSLLDGGPRTASALVIEDVEAIVVDRGDLEEFLRIKPDAALDMLAAFGKRLRQSSTLLRHTVTRNAFEAEADTRTIVMKIADWISDFSGSLPFLFLHLALFFVWIVLNVAPLRNGKLGGFDPFPFGLLTMVVSLEAIILSVFVLLSQNRQAARERVRADIEYDVNLKAEMQIAHMHEKVDQMNAEVLARLAKIEAAARRPS